MAVDYTIAAIPTVYRERKYRSRLEARWAAFFDELGWTHEYEPFDLGVWSPDFLISENESRCFVEVKPITAFDGNVASKMETGVAALTRGETSYQDHLLLVGTSPIRHHVAGVQIGWWSCLSDAGFLPWMPAFLALAPRSDDDIQPDIVVVSGELWLSVLAATKGEQDVPTLIELLGHGRDEFLELWAKATNHVQWLGKNT